MGKFIDLTGQRFNKWFVIKREANKNGRMEWLCRCDCGNEKIVSTHNLKENKSKSCGCLRYEDLVGQRFGKLLVIEQSEIPKTSNSRYRHWECLCDCGNKKIISENSLKKGSTKSCGCIRKDKYQKRINSLIGKKFGKLTIIKFNKRENINDDSSRNYFECVCDCGNIKIVEEGNLTSGKSNSCGCLALESSKKNIKKAQRSNKKELGLCNFNTVYLGYKNNARRKNREFELSKEVFRDLNQQRCYYCGSYPNTIKNSKNTNGQYVYNGIDRIDSSKGYTIDNVVTCCQICNIAKKNFSEKDFLSWVKRVYNYSILKRDNDE